MLPACEGASHACQLRGGSGRLGSTSKGWLKGTVDLISKVVSQATGVSSNAAHRSAMSSRLILPCGTDQHQPHGCSCHARNLRRSLLDT